MSDELIPMPPVRRACKRCSTTEADIESGYVIVSPSGIAHHADWNECGRTECGKDATDDAWWWPL